MSHRVIVLTALLSLIPQTGCVSYDSHPDKPEPVQLEQMTQPVDCSDLVTRLKQRANVHLDNVFSRDWDCLDGECHAGLCGLIAASLGEWKWPALLYPEISGADTLARGAEYLYLKIGQQLLIFDIQPVEQTRLVSATPLPDGVVAIHAHQDRLVIHSMTGIWDETGVCTLDSLGPNCLFFPPPQYSLTILDVSAPGAPTILGEIRVKGYHVDSHRSGPIMRTLILTQPLLPDLVSYPATCAGDGCGYSGTSCGGGLSENRRIIENSSIADWLPTVTSIQQTEQGQSVTSSELLGACTDYYLPDRVDTLETLAVLSVDLRQPEVYDLTVIAGQPDFAYMTEKALYLARRPYWFSKQSQVDGSVTDLFKFKFDPDSTRVSLSVSTRLEGQLLDRFSMREHGENLRVVTQVRDQNTEGFRYRVGVLAQSGNRFATVGQVEVVEPEVQITARLLSNHMLLAPLDHQAAMRIVDFSNPTHPRQGGQIGVPARFSVARELDDGLLGILDAQCLLRLFNVSDPAEVIEVAQLQHGRLQVGENPVHPKHLQFDASRKLLVVPEMGAEEPAQPGLVIYQVSAQDGLQKQGLVRHDLPVSRSILLEDHLLSISGDSLKVVSLDDLEVDCVVEY